MFISPGPVLVGAGSVHVYSADTPVQWSVQEAGGGSITPDGVYTAPDTPGVFHIVATDPTGVRLPATVTVTVVEHGFTSVGTMTVVRWQPTATLLRDGTVLLAGGDGVGTAEVFDPGTGEFTPTGRMTSPRSLAAATLLEDGRVLITGGEVYSPQFVPLATAELYDPATRTFTAVDQMTQPRTDHRATLLLDGRVLVIDGAGDADLYDPGTTTFAPTSAFSLSNAGRTTTLLPGGKVLAIGELGPEIFDPATGMVTTTGPMTTVRQASTATLLPSGMVLIVGGLADGGFLDSAEVYDPTHGSFAAVPNAINPRAYHLATLLPSGAVLLAGGLMPFCDSDYGCSDDEVSSAELLDPATGQETPTGSMETSRSLPFASTALQDGGVLVTGKDFSRVVEVYQ